jgi:regulator of sigma E protease
MTSLLAFVVVLAVLIFIHELGHFITAKLAGIAVPRFSIGLGPRIWGVKVGETEYVLSALPLGGYVKMAGMGEDEALEQLEGGKSDLDVPVERRFDSKPVGTRAVVISAGVVMNFVFGILAFAGLSYYQGYAPLVAEVREGWPAAEAGVQPGDLIVAVDGKDVDLWMDFAGYISRHPGDTVRLTIERDGRRIELTSLVAVFDTTVADTAGRDTTITLGRIGVTLETENPRRAFGPLGALAAGTRQTIDLTGLIVGFLGQLVTGQASARELGGPILIGQYSGQAARAGLAAFIGFMAFLSVNLAVLNLLPIPILDGGHLVFLAVEAVRGRALSLEARARLSQLGFILILALMVWVVTSDVLRLAGR